MTLKLVRKECKDDGVFSELRDGDTVLFQALEHSYGRKPKIPAGTYTCKRRVAKITHGDTFEITGVEGHKDLLFHCGNFNKDSEGCVLLGKVRRGDVILHSGEAFTDFMHLLDGVKEFTLIVS